MSIRSATRARASSWSTKNKRVDKMDLPAVRYLGPPGTHTHSVINAAIAAGTPMIPTNAGESIADLLKGLGEDRADESPERTESSSAPRYAVIPIVNSQSGLVNIAADTLIAAAASSSGVRVLGTRYLPVHHALLSNVPLDDQSASLKVANGHSNASERTPDPRYNSIKRVYSHNEALAQCSRFLAKNLPHAELLRVSSTAGAAETASKEEGSAAIASESCGAIYGIGVLDTDIEDAHGGSASVFIGQKQGI